MLCEIKTHGYRLVTPEHTRDRPDRHIPKVLKPYEISFSWYYPNRLGQRGKVIVHTETVKFRLLVGEFSKPLSALTKQYVERYHTHNGQYADVHIVFRTQIPPLDAKPC